LSVAGNTSEQFAISIITDTGKSCGTFSSFSSTKPLEMFTKLTIKYHCMYPHHMMSAILLVVTYNECPVDVPQYHHISIMFTSTQ